MSRQIDWGKTLGETKQGGSKQIDWGKSLAPAPPPPPKPPSLWQRIFNRPTKQEKLPSNGGIKLEDLWEKEGPKAPVEKLAPPPLYPVMKGDIAPGSAYQGQIPSMTPRKAPQAKPVPVGGPSSGGPSSGGPVNMFPNLQDDIAPGSAYQGEQPMLGRPEAGRIHVSGMDILTAPLMVGQGVSDSLGVPAVARLFGVDRETYEQKVADRFGGELTEGQKAIRGVGNIAGSIGKLMALSGITGGLAAKAGLTGTVAKVASSMGTGAISGTVEAYGAGADAKTIVKEAVKTAAFHGVGGMASGVVGKEAIKLLNPIAIKYPDYAKALNAAVAASKGMARGVAGGTARAAIGAATGEEVSLEEIIRTGFIMAASEAIMSVLHEYPFTTRPGETVGGAQPLRGRTADELIADGYEEFKPGTGIFVRTNPETGHVEHDYSVVEVRGVRVHQKDIWAAERRIGRKLTAREIARSGGDKDYFRELEARERGPGSVDKPIDLSEEFVPAQAARAETGEQLKLPGNVMENQSVVAVARKLEEIVTGKPAEPQVEASVEVATEPQTGQQGQVVEMPGAVTAKQVTTGPEQGQGAVQLPTASNKPSEPAETAIEPPGAEVGVAVSKTIKSPAYHAGDLGKAEHLGRQDGGRDTGHFGTGTYFVGNKDNINLGGYKDRPQHEVDLEGYNLFTPKSEAEAVTLHEALKFVNNYWRLLKDEDTYQGLPKIVERLEEVLFSWRGDGSQELVRSAEAILNEPGIKLVVSQEKINEVLSMKTHDRAYTRLLEDIVDDLDRALAHHGRIGRFLARLEEFETEIKLLGISAEEAKKMVLGFAKDIEGKYGDQWFLNAEADKSDSISTRLMKALGYEGVDVRHISSFDDTQFGSVVYDLKERGSSPAPKAKADKVLPGKVPAGATKGNYGKRVIVNNHGKQTAISTNQDGAQEVRFPTAPSGLIRDLLRTNDIWSFVDGKLYLPEDYLKGLGIAIDATLVKRLKEVYGQDLEVAKDRDPDKIVYVAPQGVEAANIALQLAVDLYNMSGRNDISINKDVGDMDLRELYLYKAILTGRFREAIAGITANAKYEVAGSKELMRGDDAHRGLANELDAATKRIGELERQQGVDRDLSFYDWEQSTEVQPKAVVGSVDLSDLHNKIVELGATENATITLKREGKAWGVYVTVDGKETLAQSIDGKESKDEILDVLLSYSDSWLKAEVKDDSPASKLAAPKVAKTDGKPAVKQAEADLVISPDDRTYENVGPRSIKSIQHDNPAAAEHIQSMAQYLLYELEAAVKGERTVIRGEDGMVVEVVGQKRKAGPSVERILDNIHGTYADVRDALERIIKDEGSENTALAKRIELVIDDNLVDGYTNMFGGHVGPDEEYVKLTRGDKSQELATRKEYEHIYDQRPYSPESDVPLDKHHAEAIQDKIDAGAQVDVDNSNKVYADGLIVARIKPTKKKSPLAAPKIKPDKKEGEKSVQGDNKGVSKGAEPTVLPETAQTGQAGSVDKPEERQGELADDRPRTEPAQEKASTEGRLPEEGGALRPDKGASDRDNQGGTRGRTESLSTRRDKGNYRITETDRLGIGGLVEKYNDNISAIKLLKQLEAEGRQATDEEKATLVRYVGWGGMPQAFQDNKEKSWNDRAAELKRLLTKEEYGAARKSTLNAHYTAEGVIRGIYSIVEQLGFTGGKVLEPALGSGNFFGLMPEGMARRSQMFGVELDSVTGRIAQQLYQNANIQVAGFEDTNFPDNYFDLAISNVPFGNFSLHDPKYNKFKFMIHDYFFAKTLDKVRPDGLIAFITSKGTLDKANSKAREYMAQRAELVGAIRLPDTAFKENANTEVTTDILIMRKLKEGEKPTGAKFAKANYDAEKQFYLNEYYENNPEMMLGTMEHSRSMYGGDNSTLKPDGRTITDVLSLLPKDIYTHLKDIQAEQEPAQTLDAPALVKAASNLREGSYFKQGDKLYRLEGGKGVPDDTTGLVARRISGLIDVRTALKELYAAQIDGIDDAGFEKLLAKLNKTYDAFVKKYGYVANNANVLAFRADPEAALLLSLEDYDPVTKTGTKMAVFRQRSIGAAQNVKSADTPLAALSISLNQRGVVDVPYMAELLDKSEAEVVDSLQDSIYKDPETGKYEEREAYLSGNVRKKLEIAKQHAALDKDFEENVKALEKVQPAMLTASDIQVRLGAPWLAADTVKNFMAELLELRSRDLGKLEIIFDPHSGSWIVDAGLLDKNTTLMRNTWGTRHRHAVSLIESALNMKSINVTRTVTDEYGNKRSEKDIKATVEARQKLELINQRFQDWIYSTQERRDMVEQRYNEVMNNLKLRSYDGRNLDLPGISSLITLFEHQRNAIARIIYGQNVLLAHDVGAGKTFVTIAGAMEMRRLGIAKKIVFAVPNNKIADFANDFNTLYPNAVVLALEPKDITSAKRKAMFAKIANSDFDAVIMGHRSFGMIPVLPETEKAFLDEQIAALEQTIEDTAAASGSKVYVKQLEAAKSRLEDQLKGLLDKKRDDWLSFEEMGIDALFVDEAHNFKNLQTYSKMRISGVSSSTAKKTTDLLMKTNYLNKMNGKIVFATATPVSNSMTEIYTMMRYLVPDKLEEYGLTSFDAWAAAFGEVVSAIEIGTDGTFRTKERFAKFFNVPELVKLFREFTDVVTSDMLDLPVPKIAGGQAETVVCDKPEELEQVMKWIQERAERLRREGPGDGGDNFLLLTTDGRMAAVDIRLMAKLLNLAPESLDYPSSKINTTIRKATALYHKYSEHKAAQLIFLDSGIPAKYKSQPSKADREAAEEANPGELLGGRYDFDLYSDIKDKLIREGIPASEIAFIHEGTTPAKKGALLARVRSGDVRFLIGSTAKMGEGMNAQDRLIGLHHIDAPWRPSDIKQREGRQDRQGNMFYGLGIEVHVYRYVTEGSFDSYIWQTLARKASFIGQIMRGSEDMRTADDVDEVALNYNEITALATGNPLILEKAQTDAEVAKLKMLKASYQANKWKSESELRSIPGKIKEHEQNVKALTDDKAQVKDTSGKSFRITLGGKTYTDRALAAKELEAQIDKVIKDTIRSRDDTPVQIGELSGFKVFAEAVREGGMYRADIYLQRNQYYRANWNNSGTGGIASLEHTLRSVGTTIEWNKSRAEQLRANEKALQAEVEKGFAQDKKLNDLIAEQARIDAELGLDKLDNGMDNEIDDGGGYDDPDDDTPSSSSGTLSRRSLDPPKLKPSEGKGAKDQGKTVTKKFEPLPLGAKGKAAKPVSKDDVYKFIDDWIGIGIGHFHGKDVEAIYKEQVRLIRMKVRNSRNIDTLTHELGHAVHELLNIDPFNFANELTTLDYVEKLMRQHPKTTAAVALKEGVAEFFRMWLTNPKQAEELCPNFYNSINNTLYEHPDVQDKLFTLQQIISDYHKQDSLSKVKGFIASPPTREGLFTNLYAKMVDRIHPIEQVVDYVERVNDTALGSPENPAKLARNARRSHSRVKYFIEHGQAKWDSAGNATIIGPSLMEILQPIEQLGHGSVSDFEAFLVARHALEISERGMESGIDHAVAQEALDILDAGGRTKLFAEQAELLYEFQGFILHQYVDAGILSQDQYDNIRATYKHYVPWYRASEGRYGGSRTSAGRIANVHSGLMRQKGGDMNVYSPLANIVRQVHMVTETAAKNMAMQALAKLAEPGKAVEGIGWFLDLIPTPMTPIKVNIGQIIERLLRDGKLGEGAELDLEQEDILMTLFEGKHFGNAYKGYVSYFDNGEVRFMDVHDKELLKSVMDMDTEQLKTFGALGRWVAKVTRTAHVVNPFNSVWNFTRDQVTGGIFSENNYLPFLDGFKGLWAILTKSDEYQDYLLANGAMMTLDTFSADSLNKNLGLVSEREWRQKVAEKLNPIGAFSTMGNIAEHATKVGEFKKARKAGKDWVEAAEDSATVRVDHTRSGRHFQTARTYIPFINTWLQSLDQVIRGFKDKPARSLMRSILYITMPTIALYLLNRENPNFDEKNPWVRSAFWLVPIGDPKTAKHFVHIPKPFILGSIFGTVPERFLEWADKNDPHSLDGLAKEVFKDASPSITVWPLQLPMELKNNVDNFRGIPIVPQSELKKPPAEQFGPYTPELAKRAGKALNISPRKIDHATKQLTGKFGKYINLGADALLKPKEGGERAKSGIEYAPVIGEFIQGTSASGAASINRFYDEKAKLEVLKNKSGPLTAKERQEVAMLPRYEKHAAILAKWRKQERAIHAHKTMTATEKQRQLEEVSRRQINLIRTFYGKDLLP